MINPARKTHGARIPGGSKAWKHLDGEGKRARAWERRKRRCGERGSKRSCPYYYSSSSLLSSQLASQPRKDGAAECRWHKTVNPPSQFPVSGVTSGCCNFSLLSAGFYNSDRHYPTPTSMSSPPPNYFGCGINHPPLAPFFTNENLDASVHRLFVNHRLSARIYSDLLYI
ncbi:uncharacterized protein BO97DRAFT_122464 [Aspergillus homomorphus CBS 101889]|uniref:Uncharacterized protein n=1 Tax=Aspergillus homomorphus (strain CBS 101889) TaxID=1450537 RepID=A0A395HRK1_ASPHC|nr:hypothetical protein BO97DRAFT_122464 [Aspergillus homomorphus CBS 101889]RAL10572.1 hypothetical protein BO97DRAFT_122464 [Aspergillus homomorphus CBS 101889]